MFQAIFGAIFTVIIALEFKRSLLVVAQRQESIVQVRTVPRSPTARTFGSGITDAAWPVD